MLPSYVVSYVSVTTEIEHELEDDTAQLEELTAMFVAAASLALLVE
jgi:hypothetical protein